MIDRLIEENRHVELLLISDYRGVIKIDCDLCLERFQSNDHHVGREELESSRIEQSGMGRDRRIGD